MTIDEMILFVGGMPRSGSTWTYNVLRRLIELSGRKPLPEAIPPDPGALIEQAFSTPAEQGYVYCIKTHDSLPLDRENVRVFCNYRDIRDVTLSYMRFMKTSFERALQVAQGCMGITDYYLNQGSASVYPVDYDDIISCPTKLVADMAAYLGLDITPEQVEDIVATYSRDRIRSKQADMLALSEKKTDPRGLQDMAEQYTLIQHGDGSLEIYDSDTGFQSHHFTSAQEGEWRAAFTQEQRERLEKLSRDWLLRYGYPV